LYICDLKSKLTLKKILTLLLVVTLALHSFAALPVAPPQLKATEILIPIGKAGKRISLYDLAYIRTSDYEKATGQHLRLADKIGFKIAQRSMRKQIRPDGTVSKKMRKYAEKMAIGDYPFHIGGFMLGFFFSFIGLLVAFLINDDYKEDRTYWAWWGVKAQLAVLTILILLLL
jgi:hypothetical protein